MRNRGAPRVISLALTLIFGLAGVLWLPFRTCCATRRDVTGQTIYDIVGVGLGTREILLATPIGRSGRIVWRFRKIALTDVSEPPLSGVLSSSGTKLLVGFSSGKSFVVDLTQRVTEIGDGALPLPQHRLPKQRFPIVTRGKVCLLDDLGASDPDECTDAAAAAVSEDGRVLYVLNDGSLRIVGPSGSRQELSYRLPKGSKWKLLADRRGGQTNFLVLVTDATARAGSPIQTASTRIVDPSRPAAQAVEYEDPVVAELRAELEWNAAGSRDDKHAADPVGDNTLLALADSLRRESGQPALSWSFYTVSPDPDLYAPIVELAPGEPDFPTDVNIWREIAPLARGATRQDYEQAYASLGDRRWSQCTSYVRTLSYPGTWLLEYWYYYPFDEGKPHAHIHDSEHMFIEVDKLGGTVRNVFASDHDSFVPNNLYSVLVNGAAPVTLPLYATAEFGKHAMAPDLDHDGRFTSGIDDNLHPGVYAIWGLRDVGKKKGDLMEPYRSRMSLPRRPEDRFALADEAALFPGFEANTGHPVCRLQPLPEETHCENCAVATPEAAMAHLVDHPDAQEPEKIYKPYVLPWREVRFGVGILPWDGGRVQLSVAVLGDFRHMTGGLLPLPARFGLEYAWTPVREPVLVHLDGQYRLVSSSSTMFAGFRIERMVTNTQGFYFGLTPTWIHAAPINGNGPPATLTWQYGGLSYHTGYVLELPSAHKGNFTNHIGVQIQNSPFFPVLFEWRVSFGFFRQRGRHDFGARLTDRNPYE
ncbi:MAG TPA: hypothetical protein VLW83_01860 [Candidatus Acidoferrales bacterium]|nr:hypothetical protein [Candidatus Acidoferrales bacterium]